MSGGEEALKASASDGGRCSCKGLMDYLRATFTSDQLCFLSFLPFVLLESEGFMKVLASSFGREQELAGLCSLAAKWPPLIVIRVSICLSVFITNSSSGSTA